MGTVEFIVLGILIIILLPILTYFMSKAAVLGKLMGTRCFIKLYGRGENHGKEK